MKGLWYSRYLAGETPSCSGTRLQVLWSRVLRFGALGFKVFGLGVLSFGLGFMCRKALALALDAFFIFYSPHLARAEMPSNIASRQCFYKVSFQNRR